VRRIVFAVPVLALITALPAEAEMFGLGFQPCGDKTSTLAVAECVQAKTTVADQRLNAAYKALQARIDASQRQPLLAAQRLWLQYRDANCGFYGVQDGSIRQVQAAECIRSMTEDRARELEKAMTLIGGARSNALTPRVGNSHPVTSIAHRHVVGTPTRTHCTTCRHAVGQFGT
jgi:uncharacterized protein YecT (DUF1311 family)